MAERERETPAGFTEKAFVVVVLLLSTSAFLNLGGQDSGKPDEGSMGMQVLWLCIYLFTIILLWRRPFGLLAKIRKEIWLILLVGYTLCSTFWSCDPRLTVRRGIALICTTLFALYFAGRYPLKQQLRLLAAAFGIAAVFSFIFQLLGIGSAVDVGVPGWIGVYVQKNVLGANMALGTAVMLIVRLYDIEYRNLATLGATLALALLILSRSMTSVLMLLAVLSVFPLSRWVRRGYRTVVMGALIVIPLSLYGLIWVLHNLPTITSVLGRDPTLTGRVPLWILSAILASRRPWLGYGYNAFWRGLEGPSAPIWRLLSWKPPNSHNGFLEVWLGLGLLGLGLLLVSLIVYTVRAVRYLRAIQTADRFWPLMFLALTVVSNLTGANILSRNTLSWILYVAVGSVTATLPSDVHEDDHASADIVGQLKRSPE